MAVAHGLPIAMEWPYRCGVVDGTKWFLALSLRACPDRLLGGPLHNGCWMWSSGGYLYTPTISDVSFLNIVIQSNSIA